MKKRPKKAAGTPRPKVRIPLPKKSEKRHGDAKKFHRQKEKEKLRREIDLG